MIFMNVKKIFMILVVLCISMFASVVNAEEVARYKLYSTTNIYTVLKLDTVLGYVNQVHISVEKGSTTGDYPINASELCDISEGYNGRFVLHATGNMYNFVLMDTKTGKCWQLQWSFNPENRVIIPIY